MRTWVTVLAIVLLCVARTSASAQAFDVLIRNGHIMDGTGSPWYSADVGIRNGKIAAIGRLHDATAKTVIDARNLLVTPGFIDMLGQSELSILVDPRLPSKIFQGITTEITGEGNSVAPLNSTMVAADRTSYDHLKLTPEWATLGQYFARIEKQGMGINLASYVGATSVRRMILGDGNVQPTPKQLKAMQDLVVQAMREGAVGLSTALQYTPAPYAKTSELIALASAAAPFGGIYATHMRSEGDAVLESIDEAVQIGREAHIPVRSGI
jgi:N-acyl-D-amino-acid deacylase